MNGAESVVRTMAKAGVRACFANPGTSEIHLVAALDEARDIRAVPCLFEGVATGAADGFARMTGTPASTLLHMGPGLANGLANLHNASRARVPVLNLVGDHTTLHRPLNAPLTADIEGLARPFSTWLRTSTSAARAGLDCAEALAACAGGGISTLIVPADVAWNEGAADIACTREPMRAKPEASAVARAARLLRNGRRTAILLGGRSAQGAALDAAGRIAAATGAKLLAPFSFTRIERGAGRPLVERIVYVPQAAREQLKSFEQVLFVSADTPVAFFGHPTEPGVLLPEECEAAYLARAAEDETAALLALEAELDAHSVAPLLITHARISPPQGAITLQGLTQAVAALLPENAIVVDESITSGRGMLKASEQAPPHDWLVNTGGSIGIGMPLSVGVAIACPDRPVLCLSGDGSLMYTLQALWTAAREGLRITLVVFANRSYAILDGEREKAGIEASRATRDLLGIDRPTLDFVLLARGMGVPASRPEKLEDFTSALRASFESGGPSLIEVRV